ncbi:hypothetical protein T07_15043 [Trichinella nelsoni]|uniref:Uncharacterized protein n=1 Tax=Trichinella nelsoni TaxID=6336 RepID=A0A0V0RDM6_9BILA|nr:hypothetical protein T07_15043 [Trichinella nelsoni]
MSLPRMIASITFAFNEMRNCSGWMTEQEPVTTNKSTSHKSLTKYTPPTSYLQAVNDATKKTPTTHDVEERVNVWNRYGESDANGPVVPVVPLGPKALKERHRSAIKVSRCPIERQENCENMALKTTDTTEKAPTMEESVGQKKLCH